ncbi:hypothetical protein KUH03_01505 [Sphingobacterium sp. E70]|uniref:hypothetical protein n=1 Tax=Sphingobacterium sp. E70 TaxID=2853439 RepID=UPI00211D155D|nr:hypothetical protein [Sphingobacterium sp. E70]ULT25707.1 hypothetical protein KUH03_01505 [Sphingobacterium sp. E70]
MTGNDQIGDYQYLDTWGTGFAYQGITGLYPTRVCLIPILDGKKLKRKNWASTLAFQGPYFPHSQLLQQ